MISTVLEYSAEHVKLISVICWELQNAHSVPVSGHCFWSQLLQYCGCPSYYLDACSKPQCFYWNAKWLNLYASIIRANHSTFFHSSTVLSYFIAWLKLDLGIEMCFYNGLDAYIKTWLQFIFPMYIWTIMIILIALSRRYAFVVRLCGSNIVQVLATLFLLSYAKLVGTIIIIFQPTILVYPDGYKRTVWLYDGNVDYLSSQLCWYSFVCPFLTQLVYSLYSG